MLHQIFEEPVVNPSPLGQPAATIHRGLPPCQVMHQRIHYHIARPCIEGTYLLECTAGRDIRDVADASEIDDHPAPAWVAKKQGMGEGRQRRPFSAGSEIARPEVPDRRDTGPFRDDGRLSNLKS
jgi:hypothetical protein